MDSGFSKKMFEKSIEQSPNLSNALDIISMDDMCSEIKRNIVNVSIGRLGGIPQDKNVEKAEKLEKEYYERLCEDIAKRIKDYQYQKAQGEYINASEGLRNDAAMYKKEVVTNLAGVVIGKGISKATGKIIKKVAKTRVWNSLGKKHLINAKAKKTQTQRLSHKPRRARYTNMDHLTNNASKKNFSQGRIDDAAKNIRNEYTYFKDSVFEYNLIENPTSSFVNSSAGKLLLFAFDHFFLEETDNNKMDNNKPIKSFSNKGVDFFTDFIPIVSNAKAGVNSLANFAAGWQTSRAAERIDEQEREMGKKETAFRRELSQLLDIAKRKDAVLMKKYVIDVLKIPEPK